MKEKEKYVGNTVREERKRKSVRWSFVALLVLVALLIVLTATGTAEKITDNEDLSDGIAGIIGVETEKTGFPVNFSTNDIVDVKAKGNDLYVLTEKFVTPVSKKGVMGTSQQISYAKPAIHSAGDYAVVFDRLSNKYTFIDKKGLAQQRQDENGGQILGAAVTENGEVLLALSSNSSSSKLHIVDKKGEDVLIWSCGEEYIVSVDKSGDTVYCAALGAFGGEIYTKLYVLQLGEEEPVCEYTLHGDACISLRYISGNKFSVLCDNALYICKAKKEETVTKKITFDSKILFFSTQRDGNTALILEDTENFSKDTLSVFDSDGDIVYSVSVDENILDLSLMGGQALLLYENEVKTFSSGGKEKEVLSFTGKCTGVATAGKKIYCYSLGGVEKAAVNK